MAKFYAWSTIQYDADVDESGASIKHKRVPFGEEVNKTKLKVTDEDWAALIEGGSVREMKPPDIPATWQGSPVEYLRAQAAKAEEAGVAMSMGGSYFGPNAEDILLDPEGHGIPLAEGVEEVK